MFREILLVVLCLFWIVLGRKFNLSNFLFAGSICGSCDEFCGVWGLLLCFLCAGNCAMRFFQRHFVL